MSAATNIPVSSEISPEIVKPSETAEFHQRVKKISQHSSVYLGGVVFTAGTGYLFKIYLARALGAEALGIYALGMSVVGFVGIFNAVGLPTAAARFVAEYSSQHELVNLGNFLRGSISLLLLGNLVLGVVFVFALPWVAVHFYHAPALASYAGVFALIMLLGVFTTFFSQCMAGFREIARRTIITHFVATTATVVLAVLLIELGFGLRGYLTAQVLSSALVLLLLGIAVWKLTPPGARTTPGFGKLDRRIVSFSATTFGIALVHFALAQSDKIVLGFYLRPKDVGIYAVAVAFAALVTIALQALNQIFSPMIAELHAAGDHALLRKLYVFTTKWAIIVTLPLAFSVMTFAGPLMGFFGPVFRTGAAVLAIVTFAQLFNCGVGSVGYLLLMSGHHNRLMKIEAVNAAVMIGLSLLLVPRWGIIGASIATATSIIGTNLWALVEVRKWLALSPYNASYFKLILPAGAAIATLALCRHGLSAWTGSWAVAPVACIGAYVAFFAVFVLSGLHHDDRVLAGLAWKRLRNAVAR